MESTKAGSIKFIPWLRPALALTVLVLLGSLLAIGAFGLALSPDLGGGTMVHLRFDGPVDEVRLRRAIPGAAVAPVLDSGGREVLIQGGPSSSAEGKDLLAALEGQGSYHCLRKESVGPALGHRQQGRAALALASGLALVVGYLALRFRGAHALAAAAALFHDGLVVLGVLALLGIRIDLGVVAALLAILGYSLNDSIVLLDRVRENLRLPRGKARLVEVLNRSLNQSIARTAMTSLTTLMPVIMLLWLGGPCLRGLATALAVGVVAGTWSSLVVVTWAVLAVDMRSWLPGVGSLKNVDTYRIQ